MQIHRQIEALKIPDNAKVVAQMGLELVIDRYGPGSPDPREYHNDIHGLDVMQDTYDQGYEADESPQMLGCFAIAGVFHDSTQGHKEPGLNERLSAESAVAAMRKIGGFKQKDIELVEGIIPGTQCIFLPDGSIVQFAEDGPALRLADGDLASLGKHTAKYLEVSNRVRKEIHPNDSDREFLSRQLKLLKNFSFHTDEARKLFPNVEENYFYLLDEYSGFTQEYYDRPAAIDLD